MPEKHNQINCIQKYNSYSNLQDVNEDNVEEDNDDDGDDEDDYDDDGGDDDNNDGDDDDNDDDDNAGSMAHATVLPSNCWGNRVD